MEFWIYDFGDLEKGIRKRHPIAIGSEWRNEAKQSHDSGKDKQIER